MRNSWVGAAAAVFAVALAVHALVAWWYVTEDPYARHLVADAHSYHEWALRWAEAGAGAQPVFHQPPLFPALLALTYARVDGPGQHVAALGLVGFLNALALALLVPLGRVWFGSVRAGWLAGLLALGHGPIVFYGLKLLPVSLALATQAAALVTLGVARLRPSVATAAVAGVAWGVAALARAEILLFLPVAALAVALAPNEAPTLRRRATLAGALLAGGVLALLPAFLHNANNGDLVPVASGSGENLFIGNQRGATGTYMALDPSASDIFSQRAAAAAIPEREAGRTLRPSEVSAYWRGRALAEVAADPGAWLALEGRKLLLILHPGDPPEIYSFSLERGMFLTPLWALPLGAWTLFALAGAGLAGGFSVFKRDGWPLLAFLALHVIVLLVFFVDARLRLPLLFFLAPFGGFAIERGLRAWREGRRRPVVAVAALVLVATVVSAVATRPNARDRRRVASVLSIQQQFDAALAALGPELARPNADPLVIDLAGWVYQQKGEYAAAREQYVRALAGLEPRRAPQTRTRLASVLEKLGDHAGAAAAHDAAVAGGWANAGTYYERGMFHLRRGDRAAARRDLEQAVRTDPGWPPPQAALRSLR